MLPRPKPSLWWTFFPMFGLDLRDDDALARPLFGDVTLVTRATMHTLFPAIADDDPMGRIAGTYLAVRRRDIVNIQWFDEERHNEDFLHEARRRAAQVAAMLTITTLATSADGLVCGLQEDTPIVERHFGLRNAADGSAFMSWGSGPAIDTFDLHLPDPPPHSFMQFQAFLDSELVAPLTAIASERTSALPKPWRKLMRQASVRLASAIHAQSYIQQVLGAMTVIDMLLSNDDHQSSFAVLHQRLRTLLGPDVAERHAAAKMFQARHDYVHRGEEIFTRQLPAQAIGLAVAALCRYVHLAPPFQRHANFLTYLDLTRTAQQTNVPWMANALTGMPDAQRSLAMPVDLPLFDYIDQVVEFDRAYAAGDLDRSDRIFEQPDTESWDDDRPGPNHTEPGGR